MKETNHSKNEKTTVDCRIFNCGASTSQQLPPVQPDIKPTTLSVSCWRPGKVSQWVTRSQPSLPQRHRKTKGKKKSQIDGWMDVILELGISCTSTKTSNQHREAPKAPPRPSRQPHGSYMAPEEARSEAGTCFPTWISTSRFEAEPKGSKPSGVGGNRYINRNRYDMKKK